MSETVKLHPGKSSLHEERQPKGTIRVIQVTDTHLYDDPEGTLLGVNTLASFRQVIEQIEATDWRADLVLATGDLVHDASPSGYRKLGDMLATFAAPVHCLPGNHDLPEVMHAHLPRTGVSTNGGFTRGNWRFVMLDSVIPRDPRGRLAPGEFERLAAELAAAPERNVLVCLHHQPVAVGSTWMDTMALEEADRFWSIVDRHPQVRGVLWGHVHQTYDARRGAVRLMASPSTCVQFTPQQDKFQIDCEPPGFRILALHPDGRIESEVIRISEVPSGLDVASLGY